jgi:hypothetical protein
MRRPFDAAQASQLSTAIEPEAEYALYTWDAADHPSSIAKESSMQLLCVNFGTRPAPW